MFFTLVFHRQIAEWVIKGYWLIAIAMFVWAAFSARRSYSRATVWQLLAVLPTFLVFLYASYFLVWVVDQRKAEWLFELPGVELMYDYTHRAWYLLNAFWHSKSIDAAKRFNYGYETLEMEYTAVFFGLMSRGCTWIFVRKNDTAKKFSDAQP